MTTDEDEAWEGKREGRDKTEAASCGSSDRGGNSSSSRSLVVAFVVQTIAVAVAKKTSLTPEETWPPCASWQTLPNNDLRLEQIANP